MKTITIMENPIFTVNKPYEGDDLEIYASDLKSAEVGKVWETENQDCYPNRTTVWTESFTVVYKDEKGVAVLYRSEEAGDGFNYYQPEEVEIIWVELH